MTMTNRQDLKPGGLGMRWTTVGVYPCPPGWTVRFAHDGSVAAVALWIAQENRYYDKATWLDRPDAADMIHRRITPGIVEGTEVVTLDADGIEDMPECVVTGPGEVTAS